MQEKSYGRSTKKGKGILASRKKGRYNKDKERYFWFCLVIKTSDKSIILKLKYREETPTSKQKARAADGEIK